MGLALHTRLRFPRQKQLFRGSLRSIIPRLAQKTANGGICCQNSPDVASNVAQTRESVGAQMALVAALSNGETSMEGNVGGNLGFDSSVIACVDCFGMADFLILNGQKDSRVASAQSVKLYQALYDAGIEATLLLDGRAPHGVLGPESQAVIKSYILRTLLK